MKNIKLNYIILLSFFLYFILLFTERTISIILSFINNTNIFNNGFNAFVYITVFISLIGFIIYLLIYCRNYFSQLFKINKNKDVNFNKLIIASTIILLSGMVHTEYTNSILQFVSYGILIIGILLYLINNLEKYSNKLLAWFTFVYLVCFSMAIPVTYKSMLDNSVAIHIIEGISTYLLVAIFGLMFYLFFNFKLDKLLNPLIIIVTAILDSLIIGLEWKGNPNIFVMIFLIASCAIYIASIVIKFKVKKKN